MAYGCQFATSAKSKKGREGFIQGHRQESGRVQILEAAHKKEVLSGGRLEVVKREIPDERSGGEGSWRGEEEGVVLGESMQRGTWSPRGVSV